MQPYFRDAVGTDVSALAAILRQGAGDAEHTDLVGSYRDALADIDRSHGNYLLVAEWDSQIAAFVQLLAFRHLHGRGGRTAQIVALRIAEQFRTTGLDGLLLDHAAARARDLGCHRLQVLSSTARTDEHPFWERHGFVQLDRGYTRDLTG